MTTKNIESISYCPGGDETFDLFHKLYDDRNMDLPLATFEVPSPALQKYEAQYPEGPVAEYPKPEDRIAWWDEFLKERLQIRDDRVPSAYLSEFDQGLYGALIGGEPEFVSDPELGRISSMVRPIFGSVEEWNPPPLSKDHPWFKIYENQLKVFAKESEGKFGISHFILIDSLNYVCEAFGATNGFYAIIDDLEFVKSLYQFSLEVNCMVMDAFFEHIPLVKGGTCSNIGEWIPGGRIVSESIDCYHMMSADDFNKSGREPVEDIFERYDGGVLHIHSNGHHLIEHAATLKGLKMIKLKNDLGAPPCWQIQDEMRAKAGTMPLVIHAEFAEFAEAVDKGKVMGGFHYMIKRAPDIDSVNRVMDKLRKLRESVL